MQLGKEMMVYSNSFYFFRRTVRVGEVVSKRGHSLFFFVYPQMSLDRRMYSKTVPFTPRNSATYDA